MSFFGMLHDNLDNERRARVFGGFTTILITNVGLARNTCNILNAAWDGFRSPCSQLCTVLVETFSTRANTDCDIPVLVRKEVTSFAAGRLRHVG